MVCIQCGAEIKEGKKFCVKCGTVVEIILPEPGETVHIFCVECGSEIPEGKKFCVKCGTSCAAAPPSHKESYKAVSAPRPAPPVPPRAPAPDRTFAPEPERASVPDRASAPIQSVDTTEPEKDSGKKRGLAIGIITACAVVFVLGWQVFGWFPFSPEKEALLSAEPETTEDLYPVFTETGNVELTVDWITGSFLDVEKSLVWLSENLTPFSYTNFQFVVDPVEQGRDEILLQGRTDINTWFHETVISPELAHSEMLKYVIVFQETYDEYTGEYSENYQYVCRWNLENLSPAEQSIVFSEAMLYFSDDLARTADSIHRPRIEWKDTFPSFEYFHSMLESPDDFRVSIESYIDESTKSKWGVYVERFLGRVNLTYVYLIQPGYTVGHAETPPESETSESGMVPNNTIERLSGYWVGQTKIDGYDFIFEAAFNSRGQVYFMGGYVNSEPFTYVQGAYSLQGTNEMRVVGTDTVFDPPDDYTVPFDAICKYEFSGDKLVFRVGSGTEFTLTRKAPPYSIPIMLD